MRYSSLILKLDEQEKKELNFVLKLAKTCNFDNRHTKHVTKLALKIFDDLRELHKLNSREKVLLLYAGILHDIGVHTDGPKAHNKTALKIILESPLLQFDDKDRLIIGSIARYHRGALPDVKHDHFKALSLKERDVVSLLSAILRISDGLDYSHKNRIREVIVTYSKEAIKFTCLVKKAAEYKEICMAEKKGDLLRKTFKRTLKFKVLTIDEHLGSV